MERQPAPEITIEGGPGWQLDEAARPPADDPPDVMGVEPVRVAAGTRSRWWPLALAAAVGFAAATLLAESRRQTLAETDAGVLSLDLRPEPENIGAPLVRTADGILALQTSAVLRNTGPEPVGLERIELVGTPYRSEDLAGRRVAPEQQAVVALLRPVDCDDLSRTRATGPLRVHATTGAGSRSVDLRMNTQVFEWHDEQARSACGQAGPDMATIVMERHSTVEDRRAVLTAELSNGSAQPLSVQRVRTPVAGLRVAAVQDPQGAPLAVPLTLPAGDYDPPVALFEGRGEAVLVSVVLEVADCSRLPRSSSTDHAYMPLVEAQVGDADGRSGSTSWGGDPSVLQQLRDDACAEQVSPLSAVPPALTPEQLRGAEWYSSAD